MYRRLGIVLLIALMPVACGGYANDSGCPFGPNGKCQGSRITYKEAMYDGMGNADEKPSVHERETVEEGGKIPLHLYQQTGNPVSGRKDADTADQLALKRAQEYPNPALMPLKTPGRNMRIWISDYIAGATVVTEHYLIFEVEKPEFIIGRKIAAGMNEPAAEKNAGENK